MMTFTQDELINAIREAGKDEGDTPNSITTRELQEALGVGNDQAKDIIREAIKAGKLRPEKVYRTPIMTGIRQRILGYVLVEEETPTP